VLKTRQLGTWNPRPAREQYSVLSTQYLVLDTTFAIRRTTSFAAALTLLTLALLLATPARADEPPPDPAIQAGKDALSGSGRFPWYDRRQDDVRRLTVVPRQSAENRGDKWTDDSTPTPRTPTTFPRISLLGGMLQWVGLTALVLLLGVIAYLIATAFLKEEVSEDVAVRKVVESRRDADRVEALPFQIRAASGDFLADARRLYEAGRYSEAVIYLFSYELVQLDKHHVIRLAKGKTNRQYIRETRSRPLVAAILETTMIAFEDAFFGNKSLSRDDFERSWRRLDEFQGELAREEKAAA
jgi:hypothetical protein